MEELCRALQEAVLAADREEESAGSGYGSIFSANKREWLKKLLAQAEGGVSAGALLQQAEAALPRLVQLEAEEADHPTFDWYGDHYWETVYMGEAAACREAIALLAPFAKAGQ